MKCTNHAKITKKHTCFGSLIGQELNSCQIAELGFDETASGITSSLLKKFEEDQILEKVRKNMVAFVSGKKFSITGPDMDVSLLVS